MNTKKESVESANAILKKIRIEEGYSQTEWGEVLNKSQATIVKYETGKVFIPTDVYKVLHDKFGYNYEYLINGYGKKKLSIQDRKKILDVKQIYEENSLLLAKVLSLETKLNKLIKDFYDRDSSK